MITYNVIEVLSILFRVLEFAILIECLSSWIPQLNGNKFLDIVHMIADPILEPCRRLQYMFSSNLPVDFSPIIALFLIDIIRNLIVRILL